MDRQNYSLDARLFCNLLQTSTCDLFSSNFLMLLLCVLSAWEMECYYVFWSLGMEDNRHMFDDWWTLDNLLIKIVTLYCPGLTKWPCEQIYRQPCARLVLGWWSIYSEQFCMYSNSKGWIFFESFQKRKVCLKQKAELALQMGKYWSFTRPSTRVCKVGGCTGPLNLGAPN